MTPRADRRQGASRYPLQFGTAAFLLIAIMLVLVLFVIPERYVLSPGFRESGISFPTPRTPFVPLPAVPVAARPLPAVTPDVLPGPAEAMWSEVVPLLEAGQLGAAIPVFESYLAAYPGDLDVRRELAVTLLAAGRRAEAVTVLSALLEEDPDPDLRLLLARTLRELGRVPEASRHYALLAELRPNDEALALEWAQAHSWAGDYDVAAELLRAALSRQPSSVPLRVELARTYYAMGRVREALGLLAQLDPEELRAADADELRQGVVASFFGVTPSLVPPPTFPTALEEAAAARFEGDLGRARDLLEGALAERPNDRDLWLAYAALLEYELDDPEGALAALLEVERLGPYDPALQLRMARLEIGAARNAAAARRVDALLEALDGGAVGSAPVSRAQVLALRGDLYRWSGQRTSAASQYEAALADDPDSEQAHDGLAALEQEVATQLVELERPGLAGDAYTFADTDDFRRYDAGGRWTDVADGSWVWGGVAGQRWLQGLGLDGLDASRHGIFVDLEVARWWLWGTVRTGVDFGAERLGSEWEPHVGGSLRHRGQRAETELRFEYGPAHPLANTLQSVVADVVQERLALTYARRLNDRWSLSALVEGSRLRTRGGSVVGPLSTNRLQGSLSVGRALGTSFSLGVTTRALTFTEAAPLATAGLPLFWDPRAAFTVGPYLGLDHALSESWRLTGRLNPGLALIDERRPAGTGYEVVPHFSAELGIRHEGRRLATALELFYYQGQFEGYRAYGARLTLGARDLSGLGGGR